jgi:hypothetical protein
VYPSPHSEIQTAVLRYGNWTGQLSNSCRDGTPVAVERLKTLEQGTERSEAIRLGAAQPGHGRGAPGSRLADARRLNAGARDEDGEPVRDRPAAGLPRA